MLHGRPAPWDRGRGLRLGPPPYGSSGRAPNHGSHSGVGVHSATTKLDAEADIQPRALLPINQLRTRGSGTRVWSRKRVGGAVKGHEYKQEKTRTPQPRAQQTGPAGQGPASADRGAGPASAGCTTPPRAWRGRGQSAQKVISCRPGMGPWSPDRRRRMARLEPDADMVHPRGGRVLGRMARGDSRYRRTVLRARPNSRAIPRAECP